DGVSAFREMAGELAHDFNDTLSGLLARAQILLTNTQDPLMRRSLRMIEQVVLEGASTVRRLQDFIRLRPARAFEPVDLNQLVSEIAAAVRTRSNERLAPRTISVEVPAQASTGPPCGRAGAHGMGGDDRAENPTGSEPCKGRTSTLWLPPTPESIRIAPETRVAPPPASSARPFATGAQILVIADSEEV